MIIILYVIMSILLVFSILHFFRISRERIAFSIPSDFSIILFSNYCFLAYSIIGIIICLNLEVILNKEEFIILSTNTLLSGQAFMNIYLSIKYFKSDLDKLMTLDKNKSNLYRDISRLSTRVQISASIYALAFSIFKLFTVGRLYTISVLLLLLLLILDFTMLRKYNNYVLDKLKETTDLNEVVKEIKEGRNDGFEEVVIK